MNNSTQHKIVILEADQLHRNYLKSIISAWGYIPYCFEKETICLDNLPVLAPDLVVYGAPDLEKLFRFVTSMRLISSKLPLLILSNNHAIQNYIDTNRFAPMWMLKENANPSEIRRIISDNINNLTGNEMVSDCPLIVGNSSEILKIKNDS